MGCRGANAPPPKFLQFLILPPQGHMHGRSNRVSKASPLFSNSVSLIVTWPHQGLQYRSTSTLCKCYSRVCGLCKRCKSSFYITHTIIIWSLSLLVTTQLFQGSYILCCGFSTNHCLLQLILNPQNCTRFDLRVPKSQNFSSGHTPRTCTLHDVVFMPPMASPL